MAKTARLGQFSRILLFPDVCRGIELRSQASDHLVKRIELVPDGAELVMVLHGDLAAILAFASGKKDPAFLAETEGLEGLLRGSAKDGVQKRKKPLGGGFVGMALPDPRHR